MEEWYPERQLDEPGMYRYNMRDDAQNVNDAVNPEGLGEPQLERRREEQLYQPDWLLGVYTRGEVKILSSMRTCVFVYVVVSMLSSVACGSGMTVTYLLLPCVSFLFTMYAIVSERAIYLLAFLISLIMSVAELLCTLVATFQFHFCRPADYWECTQFLIEHFPERKTTLEMMIKKIFWPLTTFQILFLLFYCMSYMLVVASMIVFWTAERAHRIDAAAEPQRGRRNQQLHAAWNPRAMANFAAEQEHEAIYHDSPPSYRSVMTKGANDDSLPSFSLFKHDKRFKQFHSISESDSTTQSQSDTHSTDYTPASTQSDTVKAEDESTASNEPFEHSVLSESIVFYEQTTQHTNTSSST